MFQELLHVMQSLTYALNGLLETLPFVGIVKSKLVLIKRIVVCNFRYM